MTLNIGKTPTGKRGAAVKAARNNEGRTPQEICKIIAALPEFDGIYAEAVKFYNWMRDPWDRKTKVNGPFIDPARYPMHPPLRHLTHRKIVLGKKTTTDMILRRVDFLLREARSPDPLYDKPVGEALYMINNVLATGGVYFGAPSDLIKNNPWRSYAAHTQITRGNWTNLTNEHQEPRIQVWEWIKNNPRLTPEEVLARCEKWPVVTVTQDEAKGVSTRTRWEAAERYKNVDVNGRIQEIVVGKYDKARDVWTPRAR